MSLHILENDALRATISDDGAELVSVVEKATGRERIWTGDAAVWNRHAPILFPFVGKLWEGKYRAGGVEYPMKTQHGFARDRVFECLEAGAGSVTHRLESDADSRRIYPWDFRLTVRHRLSPERPGRLEIAWTVENTGAEEMRFSIGGHPGFLLPEGVNKEDCAIRFPGMDHLRYIGASPAGYALGTVRTLTLSGERAPYQADIPDTWIFEDGQVKAVGIDAPAGTPLVTLHCEQFPMLAVWANPKGPFICLEPWFGRTDDEGFTGDIDEKRGIQRLAAGGKRDIAYAIDFC